MSCLRQKRDALVMDLRRKSREAFRQAIRQKNKHSVIIEEQPLLSSTLQAFWDLSHFDLSHYAENITQIVYSTPFEELSDEEHYFLVTDLFYLVYQGIIEAPYLLKFKKNEQTHTAAFVAFLSADINSEELAYWFSFMDQQSKSMVFTMIDGQNESHLKWVNNQQLFSFLLEELKQFPQAADAYRSLLMYSQDLSKKQIDQSILYLHKAIVRSSEEQKEQLRSILLSVWMKIVQIYIRIKEKTSKIQFMVTVLAHQLPKNVGIFLDLDTLSDLTTIYEQEPLICSRIQLNLENILEHVDYTLNNQQKLFEKNEPEYYLNSLFRVLYNFVRSRHLTNTSIGKGGRIVVMIDKMRDWAGENVWLIKLLGAFSNLN